MSHLLPAHFHFLYPHWLWLLLALPLVIALVFWRQRRSGFTRLADAALLPYLLDGKAGRRLAPACISALIWLLASLALAGPTWHEIETPLLAQQPAQVLAISLAKTMYADDVAPSRMEVARFKASDLLSANAAGKNGLVGFAGEAFVVAPVTNDSNSLSALLAAMSPTTMPVDGDNAAAAIKRSAKLLIDTGARDGLIVLITDDANSDAIDAARSAHAIGLRVSVLGVGSNGKKPITLPDGSLLHDSSGNLVLSERNDARLAAIADAGGGRYIVAGSSDADVTSLEQDLRAADRSPKAEQATHWRDMGPWLLLPLLLLFALGFRRGWLLVIFLVPLALPHPAEAASWQPSGWQQSWKNLWLRPDQQAARAVAKGNPEQAEQLAHDPDWKGVGAYEAGHYQSATGAFTQSQRPEASYNLGNALAQAGQYDAAIKAYQKALQVNPQDEDAKYNLALVEKLQQQQPKNKDDKSGKSGKDGQQGKDKSQDGQGQGGQDSKGQGKDQSQNQNAKGDQQGKGSSQQSSGDQSGKAHSQDQSSSSNGSSSQSQQNPSDQPAPMSKAQQQADQAKTQAAQQGLQQQMDKALAQPSKQPPVNDLGALNGKEPMHQLPASVRQLLQSVPDDPGSLLQRKFELEYQQRKAGDQ